MSDSQPYITYWSYVDLTLGLWQNWGTSPQEICIKDSKAVALGDRMKPFPSQRNNFEKRNSGKLLLRQPRAWDLLQVVTQEGRMPPAKTFIALSIPRYNHKDLENLEQDLFWQKKSIDLVKVLSIPWVQRRSLAEYRSKEKGDILDGSSGWW